MKANENLMVGDWVKFKDSDLYHQVKVVSNKSIKFDNQKWFAKSSVDSIPLIPEILEKNGFEKWDDGWCIYDQENTGIEIAWDGTILKIGGECGNLELPAIMYVHELQHALRLCGIEKTIEL